MKKTLLITLSLILAVPCLASQGDEDLQEAIDHLVEFVRSSDVVFIRNDKEHTPEEAASHMLKKYKYARRKVKTPEDFIEHCATKSTMSGRPYTVRLEDGRTITSSDWLLGELGAYRRGAGPAGAAEVSYEMKEFRRQYGTCPTRYEDCASVAIRYPEFAGGDPGGALAAVTGDIERNLLAPFHGDAAPDTYEDLAGSFIDSYTQTQADFPEYSHGWTLDREAAVVFASSGVLCIAFAETSFTGGAHPNYRKTLVNYDASTGSRIGLSDILRDGYEAELRAAAEARFRQARQLEGDASLSEAGFWFAEDAFTLNDNFGITGEGLVFHFEAYEVAPYALGSTEFTVPYTDISELIDPEGLLKGVMK
jgi:hypothetical protein